MGRTTVNPRCNVISIRISEEERAHLNHFMEKHHKSVSDIMREALRFLLLSKTLPN
jgi:hypothetical protein